MGSFHLKRQLFLCFLPAFFIGIIYVNLLAGQFEEIGRIFSEYFGTSYSNTDVRGGEYLLYLLWTRGSMFFCVAMLIFTRFRKIVALGVVGWTGFLGGVLMALAVISMGMRGSILCVLGMFPHFLCYIPAYLVVLWHGLSYPQNRWEMQKTVFVVGAMLAGVITETYVNPLIMAAFFA